MNKTTKYLLVMLTIVFGFVAVFVSLANTNKKLDEIINKSQTLESKVDGISSEIFVLKLTQPSNYHPTKKQKEMEAKESKEAYKNLKEYSDKYYKEHPEAVPKK